MGCSHRLPPRSSKPRTSAACTITTSAAPPGPEGGFLQDPRFQSVRRPRCRLPELVSVDRCHHERRPSVAINAHRLSSDGRRARGRRMALLFATTVGDRPRSNSRRCRTALKLHRLDCDGCSVFHQPSFIGVRRSFALGGLDGSPFPAFSPVPGSRSIMCRSTALATRRPPPGFSI